MTTRPEFLLLSRDDCLKVLELNRVGRLAYMNGPSVDIEPLGYVSRGDWLFFRSSYGTKLEALAHNPFVAFQVDQIASPINWASVVAHGTVYMLPPDGGPVEKREYARAVEALRDVIPDAFTANDPTPLRETVYGLHIDSLVGRMAQPLGADRRGRAQQPARSMPEHRGASHGF